MNKTPSSAAVAFAYYMEELGDVPVGNIHTSWRGSSLESLISRHVTQHFDYFKIIMQDFHSITHNKRVNIIAKEDRY